MNRLLYAPAAASIAVAMLAASLLLLAGPAPLVGTAAAQGNLPQVPTFNEIVGKYQNEKAGIEITLPSGWKGIALPETGGTAAVMASPSSIGSGENPTSFMMVSVIDKAGANETRIPESAQRPANVPQDKQVKCDDPTTEQVRINSMDGIVTILKCTTSDGEVFKTKMYSFQTEQRFYTVGYTATSETAYDQTVGPFDDSVKTLKIQNTIGAPAVPEFPFAAAIAAAAAVSIAVVAGRSRFMRLF
jgi:hypothetical protein